MSAEPQRRSHLDVLPSELLLQVTSYLEMWPEYLMALSLTCKTLEHRLYDCAAPRLIGRSTLNQRNTTAFLALLARDMRRTHFFCPACSVLLPLDPELPIRGQAEHHAREHRRQCDYSADNMVGISTLHDRAIDTMWALVSDLTQYEGQRPRTLQERFQAIQKKPEDSIEEKPLSAVKKTLQALRISKGRARRVPEKDQEQQQQQSLPSVEETLQAFKSSMWHIPPPAWRQTRS